MSGDYLSLFDAPEDVDDDIDFGSPPTPEPPPDRDQYDLPVLDLPGAGQLTMVDEIETTNGNGEARTELVSEWVGLPAFGDVKQPPRAVIAFETEEDRARFFREVGIETVHKGTRGTLSVWWPEKSKEDLSSLRFVVEGISS